MKPLFHDRAEAGRDLARRVRSAVRDTNPLVLGLPRGGVPVAFEIAQALAADLDIFLVRKIGAPGQEELAIGAIASGGTRVVNEALVADLGISPAKFDRLAALEQAEIERRERLYRGSRSPLPIEGRTVVLVDDGLATGASMLAAVRAVAVKDPRRIVVAVPVAAPETCARFRRHVDEVICPHTPRNFDSVGAWYADFSQTTEAEVQDLLRRAAREHVR